MVFDLYFVELLTGVDGVDGVDWVYVDQWLTGRSDCGFALACI